MLERKCCSKYVIAIEENIENIEKVAIEENIENIEKVARKKHRHK